MTPAVGIVMIGLPANRSIERPLPPMTARLPFAPLETLAGGLPCEIAARLGRDSRQVYRWRADGLSPVQADRYATALGFHPANVWGDLWDDLAVDDEPSYPQGCPSGSPRPDRARLDA